MAPAPGGGCWWAFRAKLRRLDAAAQVNFLYPYRVLTLANVDSTRQLLTWAAHDRPLAVHYVSTTDVLPATAASRPTAPEPAELVTGYAQTKWVSERLVAQAADRGLPATIYRPGEISGASATGAWNTNSLLCALIRVIADTGSAPDVDVPLNLVPVDHVTETITRLLTLPPVGATYRVADPRPAAFPLLVERDAAQVCPLRTEPYPRWVERVTDLTAGQPHHPFSPHVPLLSAPAAEGPALLSILRPRPRPRPPTAAELDPASVLAPDAPSCPPVDSDLVDLYLGYLRRIGFIPTPRG
ncbi:thioester reductase domain-containing protein [Streptoalloteichus tenebrarius]|uniref:Thioester reductase domain-containing protein n=1 Tax=Streptoalloteichus tenebrarius (strain ATCC 17920 / DSM 40477 / JCM 4838 / CBS 697.72 / NBRC 16177 / NCIMB 11028 / NRRL B-12390 / A12253. 1 / ISP 5477) TaxID=1933 RepID=A0ABT1HPC9_STRSD|nr:SDR family oxidoreductase [Streptoalloteichus tenebrarius]MCP2257379.1 thioester reductase domain-containing protein [Streptoalloteichus tenebrarius]BFE98325.1 hypothetical protein GCM10020241_00010 [Streptoalloteichus tenebrarius]